MDKFIANKQGQTLAQHSVMVGRLAEHIIEKMYCGPACGHPDAPAKWMLMKQVAKLAGLLHDVGKVDQSFQRYMASLQKGGGAPSENLQDGTHIDEVFEKKRFSFEDYPRHEEVSWLLVRRFMLKNKIQNQALSGDNTGGAAHYSRFAMLEHAIYWHHAKPLRARDSQKDKFGNAERLADRMREASAWLEENAFSDFRQLLLQIDAIESTKLVELLCDSAGDAWTDTIETPAFKGNFARREISRESRFPKNWNKP